MTKEPLPSQRSPLLPDRHPQRDLFVCDIVDAVPKGDMSSMENPVFTLSTKPDMRTRRYERGEKWNYSPEVQPPDAYNNGVNFACLSTLRCRWSIRGANDRKIHSYKNPDSRIFRSS